jgi:hypothetical protein
MQTWSEAAQLPEELPSPAQRDDIENQVLGAIIGDLVRLVRLEEEGVAYLDWRGPLRVTDDAAA